MKHNLPSGFGFVTKESLQNTTEPRMPDYTSEKYQLSTSEYEEQDYFEYFGSTLLPDITGLQPWFVKVVFDKYEPIRYCCCEFVGKEEFLNALCYMEEWKSLLFWEHDPISLEEWGLTVEFSQEIHDILIFEDDHTGVQELVYWALMTANNCVWQEPCVNGYPFDLNVAEGEWGRPSSEKVYDTCLLDKDISFCPKPILKCLPVIPSPPEGYITLFHATSWRDSLDIARWIKILTNPRLLDFGFGFYLTELIDFALSWANLKLKRRFLGEAAIMVYHLPNDYALNCDLVINLANPKSLANWMRTVKSFRSLPHTEPPMKEDIIVGPVCRDVSSVNQCNPPIPRREIQYCMKTINALNLLKLSGIIYFKRKNFVQKIGFEVNNVPSYKKLVSLSS